MSIELRGVNYIYGSKTVFFNHALKNIDLVIGDGEFVALIGHTGSGKSTLIQLLNGLLKPADGEVLVDGVNIADKGCNMKTLRQKVGLVFQYPEYQLFETTVLEDVCFGPKNMGFSREECEERAKRALRLTGLPEEEWYKSPFELSGGEKRRAAIAGVIAMDPKVIVLDEPTAGLDPYGRDKILDEIKKLQTELGLTVILVSHSMDDVAKYADRIVVMNKGSIYANGSVKDIFGKYRELEEIGLAAPEIGYIVKRLKERGVDIDDSAVTLDEAKEAILKAFKKEM